MTGERNDGRFPDNSVVLARYPLDSRRPASDRPVWPLLPGTIEQQGGPDEWLVTIEDWRVAELEDGSAAPEGMLDGDLLFPQCYRTARKRRPVPAGRRWSSPAARSAG